MSKTRLAALLAVFLVAIAALVVAGCGGGDDTTGDGGETAAETAGGGAAEEQREEEARRRRTADASAPTSPIPPFEQGKTGSYTGFDIELMEAIGEEIGREPEFQRLLLRNDLPRRRAGQVRSGDLGGDDHRRTRKSGRLLRTRTTSPNRRSWSKKAATSKAWRT